jgi:hypothetical protein
MTDCRALARVVAGAMALAFVWAGTPEGRAADEKPIAKEAKTKKAPADYRGPLPFYYAKVVSPDQKEKLYAIHEKYAAEMKALQTKLRELEEARNKELDAALTPEQQARIKELREEAAQEKMKKADGGKPAAEAKPKPE